ncbi:MAG: HPr family phosphocarrier protein [Oscillospiraceae bacterium]|nr:HPr family phosphocarrier protein [Oscillospiraceae bacterium]
MKVFDIQLASINDVKSFVNAACMQPFDIDIVSGRYIIDAKSIMGIFSVDLSKPIRVEVHGTEEDGAEFYKTIKDFAIES